MTKTKPKWEPKAFQWRKGRYLIRVTDSWPDTRKKRRRWALYMFTRYGLGFLRAGYALTFDGAKRSALKALKEQMP